MAWGSRRHSRYDRYDSYWPPYVSVAERRAKALKEMEKLRKKGKTIQPVAIDGRTIARSFWGKGWCTHLESFSDYSNRLPRGRTYVRNGSVCHLEIRPGLIEAHVSGSSLYTVTIRVKKLAPAAWKTIQAKCSGQIGSMLELLQGKLSHEVMAIVADRKTGLFPQPGEIEFGCSCPDVAVMCKHVAAVLYGVGSRLDAQPELLFVLRDAAAEELISAEVALPAAAASQADVLTGDQLGDIFGIDLDTEGDAVAAEAPAEAAKKPGEAAQAPEAVAEAAAARKAAKKKVAGKKIAARSVAREATSQPASLGAAPKAASRPTALGAAARAESKAAPKPAPKRLSPAANAPAKAKRKPATSQAPAQPATTQSPARPAATKSPAQPPATQTSGQPAARAVPPFQCDANAIASLRAMLSLSASEFAGRLGVTVPSVYRWEASDGSLNLQRRPLAALQELWKEAHEK